MNKHILIIGGMGPQASICLHERLIDRAVNLGATNGEDFPRITHLSLPIDDFISGEHKKTAALGVILQSLKPFYWRLSYRSDYCV